MKLDVSKLPTVAYYPDHRGAENRIDLTRIVMDMHPAIEALMASGLIKTTSSFGCSVGRFSHSHDRGPKQHPNWDDPYKSTWFVVGWGSERDRYIANAVRKQRAGLRTGWNTLDLRLRGQEFRFEDTVKSVENDGSFEWGDFPYGGFVFVKIGDLILPVSISCLLEVEDDAAAKAIGGILGSVMVKLDRPKEFGSKS